MRLLEEEQEQTWFLGGESKFVCRDDLNLVLFCVVGRLI
jgi:hypothetical protein